MKKFVDLYFNFGSKSVKPTCRVIDNRSGELLASATRDSWEEAERAAKKEAEKHFTYGPIPAPKTVEIEVQDPEPIELTEVVEEI